MLFKYQEIIKSFTLDICDKYEGGKTFRVDIIKSGEQAFYIDLHKRQIYSLRPHGEDEDVIADEIFWIWANEILIDEEPCSTIDECLEKVNRSFEKFFELEPIDE